MNAETATDRVVCHCFGITEAAIRRAHRHDVANGLRLIMRATGAGTDCTECHRDIKIILAGASDSASSRVDEVPSPM